MTLPLLTKLSNLYSGETEIETEELLLLSIQEEVSRIIETRSSERPDETRRINLLDYGIVDNTFSELTDELEVSRAERYLKRVISHFEPRMDDIDLQIIKFSASQVHVEIKFSYYFNGKKDFANFTINPSHLS